MCLIFIAHQAHPKYPLVVVANRDEFHHRPTAAADWWHDGDHGSHVDATRSADPVIFAGRDLEGGGTWMGITRDGRFAALTNYRGAAAGNANPPSRGKLVLDFLAGSESAASYIGGVRAEGEAYNGFSLLVQDRAGLFCYSNRADELTAVEPGVHGLSNHLLNSPWPKVVTGVERIRGQLTATADIQDLSESFFAMMANKRAPDDGELPDTGVGLDRERELAPMFVSGSSYGTRSTTVLTIDHERVGRFEERSYDANGLEQNRALQEWSLTY